MLRKPCTRSCAQAGFTLIEVMIVVILVTVLLAIGLPSYQETVNKSRRSDARASLQDAVNRQEQFMLDHSRYATMEELYDAETIASEEGYYTLSRIETDDCAVDADLCFVLEATPASGSPQARDDKCTSFTIEHTGSRDAEGSAHSECW